MIRDVTKHLPPSGPQLRLLVVGMPQLGALIQQQRADVVFMPTNLPTTPANSVDAIIADSQAPLVDCLRVLRAGGRLMILTPTIRKRLHQLWPFFLKYPRLALNMYQLQQQAITSYDMTTHAQQLEQAGFTRLLAETIWDGWVLLSRGEKPYPPATSTLARVAQNRPLSESLGIIQGQQWLGVKARYVFLLIRQTPNQPSWHDSKDMLKWEAVGVQLATGETVVLAFTSLPQAVGFMQAAVLAQEAIEGINKIPKFRLATAADWLFPTWVNPAFKDLHSTKTPSVMMIPIDPTSAEVPDE
ncbi:MAG: hypothetical protein H6673_00655 [Anaerolineales bacterium]|nr:hypothetical protein [Anaerolineales bacterium]